ncbi:19913_t:CDS:2, partial [Funneliformis geosporum]
QALLTIEEIPYPHTGLNIAEKLVKTFDHWGLKEPHTIQLSVKKDLGKIDKLLLQISKPNNFLIQKDKHREQLHKMQEIYNTEVIEPISFNNTDFDNDLN